MSTTLANWQLLVAVGLPTATGLETIGLAVIQNGRNEARFNGIDARFNAMDDRLVAMEGRLQARIDRVASDITSIHLILGRHDGRIEELSKK